MVGRARISVAVLYLTMGVAIGNWGSRLPSIREQTQVSDATWGAVMGICAVADAAALLVIFVIINRVQLRVLATLGATLVVSSGVFFSWQTNIALLCAFVMLWYLGAQILATPMGSMAVELERREGIPLMSRFNMVFTVGVLLGGAMGVVCTWFGAPPIVQFGVTALVLLPCIVLTRSWQPKNHNGDVPARSFSLKVLAQRFTPQLKLLAAMSFFGGFASSVMTQWSTLLIAGADGGGQTLAAAAYTLMSVAGVAALSVGDSLVGRFGRLAILRASGFSATIFVILSVATSNAIVISCGLVLVSFAVANIGPIVDSISGNQPDRSAAEGVSVAEAGQMPGFFVSPAVVGWVAGWFDLRVGFGLLAIAVIASLILSRGVTEPSLDARATN